MILAFLIAIVVVVSGAVGLFLGRPNRHYQSPRLKTSAKEKVSEGNLVEKQVSGSAKKAREFLVTYAFLILLVVGVFVVSSWFFDTPWPISLAVSLVVAHIAHSLRKSDGKEIGLFGKFVGSVIFFIILGVLIFGADGAVNRYTDFKMWANGTSSEGQVSFFSIPQRIDLLREEPQWQDLAGGEKYRVYMPSCMRLDAYPIESISYEQNPTYVDIWSKSGKSTEVELTLTRSTHPACS